MNVKIAIFRAFSLKFEANAKTHIDKLTYNFQQKHIGNPCNASLKHHNHIIIHHEC